MEEILQKGDVADLQPSEINVDDLDSSGHELVEAEATEVND